MPPILLRRLFAGSDSFNQQLQIPKILAHERPSWRTRLDTCAYLRRASLCFCASFVSRTRVAWTCRPAHAARSHTRTVCFSSAPAHMWGPHAPPLRIEHAGDCLCLLHTGATCMAPQQLQQATGSDRFHCNICNIRSTFATFRWNTCNIRLKQLKHL